MCRPPLRRVDLPRRPGLDHRTRPGRRPARSPRDNGVPERRLEDAPEDGASSPAEGRRAAPGPAIVAYRRPNWRAPDRSLRAAPNRPIGQPGGPIFVPPEATRPSFCRLVRCAPAGSSMHAEPIVSPVVVCCGSGRIAWSRGPGGVGRGWLAGHDPSGASFRAARGGGVLWRPGRVVGDPRGWGGFGRLPRGPDRQGCRGHRPR